MIFRLIYLLLLYANIFQKTAHAFWGICPMIMTKNIDNRIWKKQHETIKYIEIILYNNFSTYSVCFVHCSLKVPWFNPLFLSLKITTVSSASLHNLQPHLEFLITQFIFNNPFICYFIVHSTYIFFIRNKILTERCLPQVSVLRYEDKIKFKSFFAFVVMDFTAWFNRLGL